MPPINKQPLLKTLTFHICTDDTYLRPSVVQRTLRETYGNNDYVVYVYRTPPEVCGLFVRDLHPEQQHVIIYDETSPEIIPAQWEGKAPGECMLTYIQQAHMRGASFVVGFTKEPTMNDGMMIEAIKPGSGCFFFTMNIKNCRRKAKELGHDKGSKYPWCRLVLNVSRYIQQVRVADYIAANRATA